MINSTNRFNVSKGARHIDRIRVDYLLIIYGLWGHVPNVIADIEFLWYFYWRQPSQAKKDSR